MLTERVAVILLSWNDKKFLQDCIDSIFRQSYKNLYLIFVDNGSADDSLVFVRKKYRSFLDKRKMFIIENGANFGFAKGNNIAVNFALKDKYLKYVAFVNPDMELSENWIENMVKEIKKDRKLGICQGKILNLRNRDHIDSCGIVMYKSFTWWSRGQGDIDKDQFNNKPDIFCTCSAGLFRREMIEDIMLDNQFFDEDFFLTCEDVDVGTRARIGGWQIRYTPDALAYHYGSANVGVYTKKSVYFMNRNHIWVLVKDFPTRFILKNIHWILLVQLFGIPYFMKKRRLGTYIRAKIDALMGLRKMIKKRIKTFKKQRISYEEFENHIEDRVFPPHIK